MILAQGARGPGFNSQNSPCKWWYVLLEIWTSLCYKGLFWELNPGPLAPEARIMPLDQTANDTTSFLTPNDVEKDNMTVIDASPMICKTFSWFRRKYFQFFAMKLAAKPKALTFWNAKQQIHETTSTTLSTQLLRYALLSNTSYSKHLLASCASLSNP